MLQARWVPVPSVRFEPLESSGVGDFGSRAHARPQQAGARRLENTCITSRGGPRVLACLCRFLGFGGTVLNIAWDHSQIVQGDDRQA